MKYRAARIPLERPPLDCSKEELRHYFAWYQANTRERIEMLQVLVRLEPATSGWVADLSRDSLLGLGRWLTKTVEMRPLSAEEQGFLEHKGHRIPIGPDTDLTDVTMAYLYDAGVYFGAALQHACPWLEWKLELRARTVLHYGVPALRGFAHRMVFEPLHMLLVQGAKVGDGTAGPDDLARLFDQWVRLAISGRPRGSGR